MCNNIPKRTFIYTLVLLLFLVSVPLYHVFADTIQGSGTITVASSQTYAPTLTIDWPANKTFFSGKEETVTITLSSNLEPTQKIQGVIIVSIPLSIVHEPQNISSNDFIVTKKSSEYELRFDSGSFNEGNMFSATFTLLPWSNGATYGGYIKINGNLNSMGSLGLQQKNFERELHEITIKPSTEPQVNEPEPQEKEVAQELQITNSFSLIAKQGERISVNITVYNPNTEAFELLKDSFKVTDADGFDGQIEIEPLNVRNVTVSAHQSSYLKISAVPQKSLEARTYNIKYSIESNVPKQ